MIGFLRGVVIPLIFPNVPYRSPIFPNGILRVPQLPPPLEHPPPWEPYKKNLVEKPPIPNSSLYQLSYLLNTRLVIPFAASQIPQDIQGRLLR